MTPVTIAILGDLLVDREVPESAFDGVRDLLAASDLRIGNCEAVYSDTAERNLSSTGWLLSAPRNFDGLRSVRFDAMTCANNHFLDGGYAGMRDTVGLLRDAGVEVAGVGEDLDEARRPAFIEADGVRVALLAYTSVYPPGYEASSSRPGCATIKIHEVLEHENGQPGTRPAVRTFVDPAHMEAVRRDVRDARSDADVVIASVHWGIHNIPAEIADYERELGHALVDAGADLVFGHHQHILKGIDVHAGKPIFYGVGNFIFDTWPERAAKQKMFRAGEVNRFKAFYGDSWGGSEPPASDGPTYPFAAEARRNMVLQVRVSKDGILEAALVPCLVGPDATPRPLAPESAEFAEFVDYLRDITARASLNGAISVRGSEILVEGVTAG